MAPAPAPIPGPLLIVDDRADVRRGLKRGFGDDFSAYVAETGSEAEHILAERRPQFVLCDYWLGPDQPVGTQLIARWRKKFPFLRGVALMTGTQTGAITDTQGVDIIFTKPLIVAEVTAWFLSQLDSTGPVSG